MLVSSIDAKTKLSFQRRNSINHGALSQAARRLNSIGVLNVDTMVYSRFLSVLASRCQVFASRLAEHGLPTEVTPAILVKKYGSVFTPKGLSKKCARRISTACKRAGLPPEQTMLFDFLKNKAVKKPSILSILHPAESTRKEFKFEPPSAESLAKISENWRKVEDDVRAFYAAKGEKVDW